MKNNKKVLLLALLLFFLSESTFAAESYIPSLNPRYVAAGRDFTPGLVSTGNIDLTTSTITAAHSLVATASAETISASGNLTVSGKGIFGANLGVLSAENSYADFIKIATDDVGNPYVQIGSYSADFSYIVIDGYIDPNTTTWKSSDAGSNVGIFKLEDKLQFAIEDGISPGNAITWVVPAAYMDLTTGNWWFIGNGSFDSVTQRSDEKYKEEIVSLLDGKPFEATERTVDPVPIAFNMSPEYYKPKEAAFTKDATGAAEYGRALASWERKKNLPRYTKRRQGLDANTMPVEWLSDEGDGYLIDAVLADLYLKIYDLRKQIADLKTK